MPQDLYCWRCDRVLPMLDEAEWAQLAPLLQVAIPEFMEEHRRTGVSLGEAQATGVLGGRALALYRDLTGFEETNLNALWHHRISLYGPPCTHCGKPLRTPRAKLCAACGRDRVAGEPPRPA
jgi:hypothetical protein